jgi:hypothetical protein
MGGTLGWGGVQAGRFCSLYIPQQLFSVHIPLRAQGLDVHFAAPLLVVQPGGGQQGGIGEDEACHRISRTEGVEMQRGVNDSKQQRSQSAVTGSVC